MEQLQPPMPIPLPRQPRRTMRILSITISSYWNSSLSCSGNMGLKKISVTLTASCPGQSVTGAMSGRSGSGTGRNEPGMIPGATSQPLPKKARVSGRGIFRVLSYICINCQSAGLLLF